MSEIDDVGHLESVVGARPLPIMMKSIDELDSHCRAIIDRSRAVVITYQDADGLGIELLGGPAGFAWDSPRTVAIEAPAGARPEAPVGGLFLTPGWRETLRVNGYFDSDFAVEEALVHCGKAVIRSKLWDEAAPAPASSARSVGPALDDAARAFLNTAPFVVIGSCDADGNADASPKGDPAGFVEVLDATTIAIPDRKGNKRTDTMHNVLSDPRVALLALTPGDHRTLEVRGRARISTDPVLLDRMAVQGRAPKVALVVDIERFTLAHSDALVAADLWNTEHHIAPGELPLATRIWTDHVESNSKNGFAARAIKLAARAAKVADTRAISRAALERDYETNLY